VASDGDRHDELFLIDGNSLAYRAFFALPESIATSTGFPTNAIFGFASMLMEQWPHLEPLVEAFGYRNVKVPGYEADDVIASIAERARDLGVPVMVVTGDRDAFQIIDPQSHVRVMATGRGITDTKVYDHGAVIDRYGIGPELIPDFYGLKGDTSDNIPGVPGIGDKTASQLLQQFGSLEGVLDHVDDITGAKRKQNLTDHAEAARISKLLATIKRDVPVEIDPAHEAGREPNRSRLREVFREFELRAPLQRLEEAFGEGDAAAPATVAETTLSAKVREGTLADVAALGLDAEVAVAVRAPEPPEGELPLVRVLRDMEIAGVRLDKDRLAEVDARVREEIDRLEREIWALAGEEFVIGSPQQLGAVLFDKLGLSKKRRGKTGFSTDARVLQAIRTEHEIVPKIERWRELTKLVQTYLEPLPNWIDPRDGRLHTTFLQTNASTGRLASINPNLQNIPIRTETGRVIRQCFIAEPG